MPKLNTFSIIAFLFSAFVFIFLFQNCSSSFDATNAATTGSGLGTSSTPGTSPTPNPTPGSTPTPGAGSDSSSVKIYCTSSLLEGSSATCSSIVSGTFTQGSWYVNGSNYSPCNDATSCTWTNIPPGNFTIKVIALDSQGKSLTSNELSVVVISRSVSQSNPVSVSCNEQLAAGQSATCSAILSQSVTSGSWYINNTKYAPCENQPTCTWTDVSAGSYTIKAIVSDSSSNVTESNSVTVLVK